MSRAPAQRRGSRKAIKAAADSLALPIFPLFPKAIIVGALIFSVRARRWSAEPRRRHPGREG
jgi:hypothetical protein